MQREIETQRRELIEAMERDRRELVAAANELKAQLRERLSLGKRMAARPAPYLIGSFCVGLLLGSRF